MAEINLEKFLKASENILVSQCLLGVPCRYDGGDCRDFFLLQILAGFSILGVCPENLGGLKGIRGPYQLKGRAKEIFYGKGKVVSREGVDVTENFIKGAYQTLEIAKRNGVKLAVLKSKSPACSPDFVYDGSFKKNLIKGEGLLPYLLRKNRICVLSEKEFKEKVELKWGKKPFLNFSKDRRRRNRTL